MEQLARSYIDKRIQQSRIAESDASVSSDAARYGKSKADLARDYAKNGFTLATASNLFLDDTLSVGQKGEILATAYAKDAENTAVFAAHARFPSLKERLKIRAHRYKRIAQGLTRASKRVQNS